MPNLARYLLSLSLLKDVYDFVRRWESFQIAKYALGKYIIGFACLLHIIWAAVLLVDVRAGNATPISIFFRFGLNRWEVIILFLFVSILAGSFLNFRMRRVLNLKVLSMLLVPQQFALLCSALAGLWAAYIQHYADGTPASWAHILCDQLPVVLTACLYSVACLETKSLPLFNVFEKLSSK
jgi:hypothetical protein